MTFSTTKVSCCALLLWALRGVSLSAQVVDPGPGGTSILRVGGTFLSSRTVYGTIGSNFIVSLFDVSGFWGGNDRLVSIHGSAPYQPLFEVYSYTGSQF